MGTATRHGFGVLVVFVAICVSTSALCGEEPQRPLYKFLRQDEDWSVLAGRTLEPRDVFDPVKYVKLDHSGSMWASFGGSARARLEGWSDFAFGGPQTNDDLFSLWRVMAHSDFHLGARFRVFLQGKSALTEGRDLPGGSRTVDLDTLALQQGFVDIGLLHDPKRLSLRLGRQGLQYGRQRLVSPLPWGNSLRAWDGGLARLRTGSWRTDVFWTRPVIVSPYDANKSDDGTAFYGAYATREGPVTHDAYLLVLDAADATFNGTTGNEHRYTLGTRLQGRLGSGRGPLGEIETAVQFGTLGSGDVAAWMLTLDSVWTLGDKPSSPNVGVSIDLATGDRSPGGNVETFNQLYPLGHAYLGIADFVGRQNIQALNAALTLRPTRRWTLVIAPHYFRRFETEDALYSAGGTVVFPGSAGDSPDIGGEIDIVASWGVNRHLFVQFGYAHFFAGRFVEQAGGPDDIDFGYGQLQFRF